MQDLCMQVWRNCFCCDLRTRNEKKNTEGQLQCCFQVTKKLHCCAIKLVYCQQSSCGKIKWHIKLYCWIRHGLVWLRAMRTLALCECLCLLLVLPLQHSMQLLYELLVPSGVAHAHDFSGFCCCAPLNWASFICWFRTQTFDAWHMRITVWRRPVLAKDFSASWNWLTIMCDTAELFNCIWACALRARNVDAALRAVTVTSPFNFHGVQSFLATMATVHDKRH